MDKNLETKLVARLKNSRMTVSEISDLMHVPETEIMTFLKDLSEKHVSVDTRLKDGEFSYQINTNPSNGNVYVISGKDRKHRQLRFGAASDVHFASKYHLPKTFNESMKRLVDAGITKVFLAGDIHDGRDIYHGHNENVVTTSIEGQTDLSAEALSKFPTLEFWGIAGNHDFSFTKRDGSKPLSILEAKIDNFKNLGDLRADVVYHGIKIRLLHGAGGRAYARSYPTQTYLRDFFTGLDREDLGNVPHVMLVGHYHTYYVGKDHGIIVVQSGSFQDGDNEYCLRRGLTGPNGVSIVDFGYANGVIDEFQTQFIQPPVAKREKGKAFNETSVSYSRRK